MDYADHTLPVNPYPCNDRILEEIEKVHGSSTESSGELLWQEDFSESLLNLTRWNIEGVSPSNKDPMKGEVQFYTMSKHNVALEDGKLKLRAHCHGIRGMPICSDTRRTGCCLTVAPYAGVNANGEPVSSRYTSGRVNTAGKVNFKYGRLAVRAKLPKGLGNFPSVSMLGESLSTDTESFYENAWPACGEIDVVQSFGKELPANVVHAATQSKHSNYRTGGNPSRSTCVSHSQNASDLGDDFHVYGIAWDENEIRWSVDNSVYFASTKKDVLAACQRSPERSAEDCWPFDKDYFFVFSLALGAWGGGVDDTSFPMTFEIDWVKAYKVKTPLPKPAWVDTTACQGSITLPNGAEMSCADAIQIGFAKTCDELISMEYSNCFGTDGECIRGNGHA